MSVQELAPISDFRASEASPKAHRSKACVRILEPSDNNALVQLHETGKAPIDWPAALGISDMDRFLHGPIG